MKDYRAAVDVRPARHRYAIRARSAAIRRSAWIVVAHGSFELAEYPQAEHAYAQVLAVTPESDESRAALVDNLAASIYKQGELANEAQDYRAAADHFLRIRTAAPTSTIRADGRVRRGRRADPAAGLDGGGGRARSVSQHLSRAQAAARGHQTDRLRLPGERPAVARRRRIRPHRIRVRRIRRCAARRCSSQETSTSSPTPGIARWTRTTATSTSFRSRSRRPSRPASRSPRCTRRRTTSRSISKELAEIVRIDADAGPERTGRTRTLAARSALVLAEQLYQEFAAVKLRQPFETSLQEKKQRMDATIEAMDRLVEYEIADVTAAATYYMAETYFDFSRSLAESERPTDLKPADLEEYEMALEEEAFPFEEKAIDVHEKNMELLQAGVFNAWTEKSLGKLAELMPGRYAKNEMSSGFLGAIDSYAYRSPDPEPGPHAGRRRNRRRRTSRSGRALEPVAATRRTGGP